MDLDTAWLNDPARVFPVVVDPSADKYNAESNDTYVQPGQPGRPDDIVTAAGKVDGRLSRAYLRFDNALNSLRNQYILGASLTMVNVGSSSCAPQLLTVFEVTQPWDRTMAWPGAAVGPALSTKSFAHGAPACPVAAREGFPLDPDVMAQVKPDGRILDQDRYRTSRHVANQVSELVSGFFQVTGKIAGGLNHPVCGWMLGNAE